MDGMSQLGKIACLGAGRMGRGIAVVFAYAGHDVAIIDAKPREAKAFNALEAETLGEIRATLLTLAGFELFDVAVVDRIMTRVRVISDTDAATALGEADVIFEGVPEVVDLKRELFARVSPLIRPDAIVASTTSTILVDDLSDSVVAPERFLNAHWLNPAFLVPLVELSPGKRTSSAVTDSLRDLLDRVGKVPVVCAARPGYIVPRIQTLAMNEAARMVEEGVASADDIDKALKFGFGFRFSVLGVLEFIDWGGGDILFYASRYLTKALGNDRYAAPDIIELNMNGGRVGLKTLEGFLDYHGKDIAAYRTERLGAFVERLSAFGLVRPPVL
jgi:3-hydroxybutyryl-CoA dehydrogenase